MWKVLQDIVDHTGALGIIDVVKVTSTDDGALVESIDDAKMVVIKGNLDEPIPGLEGEFGITDLMSNLNPMINFSNHKSDEAVWAIESKERTDVDNPHRKKMYPERIVVKDKDGIETRFRLMNAHLVPAQSELKLKEWDVTFKPSQSKIQEFNDRVALAPQELFFMATVEGGELKFYFGDPDSSSHGTAMVFQTDVEGDLPRGLYWHINTVKTILKYGMDGEINIKFSKKGAMMVEVKSDMALWKYIMPCRKL